MSTKTEKQYILRGQVVTPNEILPDAVVVTAGEIIEFIGTSEQAQTAGYALDNAVSYPDGYIMPGLVDIHSHGGGGASFPNATSYEEAMVAVREHRKAGTTSYVASLVTASPEVLKERTALLVQICEDDELAGIHLEGPFVSHERCGAQDPTYIQTGNPEITAQLCEMAKGHIKWMTLAPEVANNKGEGSVAETLIEHDALPSWGHTDTRAMDMEAALASSYRKLQEKYPREGRQPLVTHLFNGMRPIHHREPGPVMACISAAQRGEAVVEMIGDAIHLDPVIVREVYELVGRENIALITDAMEAAGMPDGEYELGSQKVIVKDRVARLAGGTSIAGGTARLIDVVRVCANSGISLVDAVYMASTTGARLLRDDSIGALTVGRKADIVLTSGGIDLQVEKVMRRGEWYK